MGRILRLYLIREMALSTLLALIAITFVFIIGQIYQLIELLLKPGVEVTQVGRVLLDFMPAILVLSVPMSLLIGVLVGVGRMTLDREMLAIRASGINLFSVFAPALVVAALISAALMGASDRLVPSVLQDGMIRISQLQVAVASSLEAGRFHEGLGNDKGLSLYFHERDPQTQAMKHVVIKMESKVKPDQKSQPAKALVATAAAAGRAKTKKSDSESTMTRLTLICAESGTIQTQMQEGGGAGDEGDTDKKETHDKDKDKNKDGKELGDTTEAAVTLDLTRGTIHQLNPKDGNYTVLYFDSLRNRLFKDTTVGKKFKTRTSHELKKMVASKETKKKERLKARKELMERRTLPLASFFFVLVGIPLAVWVRPSGKSWGILLAIMLMLVYYVLLKMGLTMVETDKPLGVLVAYSPSLLFLVVGAALWWQSVRS